MHRGLAQYYVRAGRATNIMTASVDEDLASATYQRLSIGPSIVADLIELTSCVLPRKLHPGLYDNSMKDVSMRQRHHGDSNPDENKHINTGTQPAGGRGVPGFPDFPDCWQGETSIERMNNCGGKGRGGGRKWKTTSNYNSNRSHGRQRRRRLSSRQSADAHGISKPVVVARKGKEIKKRLREERRMRRIKKASKLRERRGREGDVGAICRRLESVRCE